MKMADPIQTIKYKSLVVTKVGKYIHYVAPVMVMIAFMIVLMSLSEVSTLISSGGKSAAVAITKNHTPVLNKHPLVKADYEDIIKVISKLNPAVTIKLGADNNSIDMFTTDANNLPEWVYGLSTLQAYKPGIIWSAKVICLNKCTENRTTEAILMAYTQDISMN